MLNDEDQTKLAILEENYSVYGYLKEWLEQFLQKSKRERFEFIRSTKTKALNSDQLMIHHIASQARHDSRQLIVQIMDGLPSPNKFNALMLQKSDGDTVLHCMLRTQVDNKHRGCQSLFDLAFRSIWDKLEKSEKIAALKKQGEQGNTLLHLAVLCDYHREDDGSLLQELLKISPRKNRLELLNIKNKKQESVFSSILRRKNWNYIFKLFQRLPKDENLLNVFKEQNINGETPLHLLALNKSLQLKHYRSLVRAIYGDDQTALNTALKTKDNNDNTPLMVAAEQNNVVFLAFLIEQYFNKPEELLMLLKEKNKQGYSALDYITKNGSWKAIKKIVAEEEPTNQLLSQLIDDFKRVYTAIRNDKSFSFARSDFVAEIKNEPLLAAITAIADHIKATPHSRSAKAWQFMTNQTQITDDDKLLQQQIREYYKDKPFSGSRDNLFRDEITTTDQIAYAVYPNFHQKS